MFNKESNVCFEINDKDPINEETVKRILKESSFKEIFIRGNLHKNLEQIPKCIKTVRFDYKFNNFIDKLPDTVERIYLRENFNLPIEHLPKNLTELNIINYSYKHNIIFPNTLKKLTIFANMNLSTLPRSVVSLDICLYPDQDLDWIKKLEKLEYLKLHIRGNLSKKLLNNNVIDIELNFIELVTNFDFMLLPRKARSVRIFGKFNAPVNNVSSHLKSIEFYSSFFNNDIKELKKSNLRYFVSHSEYFDQPLDNLPKSLKELVICNSRSFNYPINNLPKNLKILKLFCLQSFNQDLDNLPNITELQFSSSSFNKSLSFLPISLKKLDIILNESLEIQNLPPIKKLNINFQNESNKFKITSLPNTIEVLLLFNINIPISSQYLSGPFIRLPDNLKVLGVGFGISYSGGLDSDFQNYDLPITSLPKSLTHLIIDDEYKYIQDIEKKFKNICIIKNENIIQSFDIWDNDSTYNLDT